MSGMDGDHISPTKKQRTAAKRARRGRKHARREQRRRDRRVTAEHGSRGHGSCGRKVRHRTECDALRAALAAMRRGAPPLWVYSCRMCGGWHLTSHPDGGTGD